MCAGQVLNSRKFSEYSYNKKSKEFNQITDNGKGKHTAIEIGGSDACQVWFILIA